MHEIDSGGNQSRTFATNSKISANEARTISMNDPQSFEGNGANKHDIISNLN